MEKEADALLGRVAGLLTRIKEVADCPGCVDRVLYLQHLGVSPAFQCFYCLSLLAFATSLEAFPICLRLRYCDAELRVITPWSDEELAELADFRDVSDKEVEELVFGD